MSMTPEIEKELYNSSHKIDKKNYIPKYDSMHWHLTRFIRQNMSPTGNISIIQDESSGMASVSFNDKSIITFDTDSFLLDFNLETPFYGKTKIVNIDNYNINLYYAQIIINNYLLFKEIIGKNKDYSNFNHIVNNELSFFEHIVSNSNGYLNLDFPFIVIFRDKSIELKTDHEIFTLVHKQEHIEFHLHSDNSKFTTNSFDKFIKKVNTVLYDKYVFSKIQIQASKFNIGHKEILNLITY